MHRLLLSSLLAAAFCAASAFGAEPAGDAQTREKLRVATLQLRDAVAERDSAKSARDALTDENHKLAEQLAALQKQAVADGVALNRLKTDSANRLAERDDEVKRLQTALKEESEMLAQLQLLARTREDARLRLVEEKLALANVLAEREGQNIELHRLAGEILRRYEQFGFGEALAAKEPFVGRTRAKLETLVQDYRDRLLAQRAPAKP